MPKELDAIARTRNAQLLAAALPAVEALIDEEILRVENAMIGAIHGKRLTAEDALVYAHQRGALTMLKSRLTRRSTPSEGEK